MGSLHQVASGPKEIIDRTMNGQEALHVSKRFKPAHVAFSLASRLMGDLSAVVGILRSAVLDRGEGSAVGDGITAQFVGDESVGDVP